VAVMHFILCFSTDVNRGRVYIGTSANDTQQLYAFSLNIPQSSWAIPVYLLGGTPGLVGILMNVPSSVYLFLRTEFCFKLPNQMSLMWAFLIMSRRLARGVDLE